MRFSLFERAGIETSEKNGGRGEGRGEEREASVPDSLLPPPQFFRSRPNLCAIKKRKTYKAPTETLAT